MPTTFCKSSYFGHNMLKTSVLPDAKLGFLNGLKSPLSTGLRGDLLNRNVIFPNQSPGTQGSRCTG